MKLVAFAGGVGGAKLVDGLAQVLPAEALTVVVNTADDFVHLGMYISPDLDTVVYTLAGVASNARGWGRSEESWQAMQTIGQLAGPTWFQLGDKDLGLHLVRSSRLQQGHTLSQVTKSICQSFDIEVLVLPMSDDDIRTRVKTDEGEMPFQEYFVARGCQPIVNGFHFEGVERAKPAPGVLAAIEEANVIVLCPSNPWVSIDPILAVPGVLEAVKKKPVLAVSPIIGGEAVKGPAAKMYRELGFNPSAFRVAAHYNKILTGFVLDIKDNDEKEDIAALGIKARALPTMMTNREERRKLAEGVLAFTKELQIKAVK